MQIVYKTLDEIYLNPNNPRHNDNAVDSVANSIKEFGFKNCIIINTDGMILAGNTRYKASKKLNLEKVPCIVADDLTEKQQRAFVIADNKTAELAEWNFEALEKELAELTAFDFDMSAFGFDESIFEEIDENELDKDNEKTGGVQITITFQSVIDYECIENEIKDIISANNGEMSVKMI